MSAVIERPPGFSDKVLGAQSTFRSVMNAIARPGRIERIVPLPGAPGPMMRATSAIALTLFDHDTPLWLDAAMSANAEVTNWLKFHTAAPIAADPADASFALVADGTSLPWLEQFSLGSSEYPDRSTTLILQVDSLTSGPSLELRGPGIDGVAMLLATARPTDLFERLGVNEALFPRGIDLVLVADDALVAIPRTTRVIVKGG